eukprot:3346857-Prymnesium_polylepis.1
METRKWRVIMRGIQWVRAGGACEEAHVRRSGCVEEGVWKRVRGRWGAGYTWKVRRGLYLE